MSTVSNGTTSRLSRVGGRGLDLPLATRKSRLPEAPRLSPSARILHSARRKQIAIFLLLDAETSPTSSPRLFSIDTTARCSRSRSNCARNAAAAGPSARPFPSSDFKATPSPSPAAQSSPSAPPFAIQPWSAFISRVSVASGPRMRSGCARIAAATRSPPSRRREPREGVRHPLEREPEREHAAAVDARRDVVLRYFGRLRVDGEHLALHPVTLEAVALAAPAPRPAEREHAGVLARAVVLEPGRRVPLRPALELVLARRRTREQPADRRQLRLVGEVRGGGNRQVAVADVVARPRQRDRLQRLGRGAHQRHQRGIARRGDHGAVPHGDRVHAMPCFHDLAAADGDCQRLDGAEE